MLEHTGPGSESCKGPKGVGKSGAQLLFPLSSDAPSYKKKILHTDGDLSCFDVIDDYFQEMCPILIRRQEFFSCRQNEGEDNSSFRDRLCALAEDGDVIGMKFEDIMCFQYIQGVHDNDLRKDLSAVKVPNLVKFNRLMDACLLYTSPSPRD